MENLKKHKYMYLIFTIIHLTIFFITIYTKNYWFSTTTPYYIVIINKLCPFIFFIVMSLSAKEYSMDNLKIKLSKLLLCFFSQVVLMGLAFIIASNFLMKIIANENNRIIFSIILYILYLTIFFIIKNKDRFFMVAIDKKFLPYIIILLLVAISFHSYNLYYLGRMTMWFTRINFIKIFKENYIWFMITFIQMIFVGIWEETIFRGMLQSYLIKKFPLYVGIILQAILFALVHLINGYSHYNNILYTIYGIYGIFIAGLVLGITYYKTKSIVYPIFLHASMDLLIFYINFIISH